MDDKEKKGKEKEKEKVRGEDDASEAPWKDFGLRFKLSYFFLLLRLLL